MTVYTAANFSGVLGDDISATNMERLVDVAIDVLNLFGATTISNMAGVAGTKTVTLTSKQHGAVSLAVRQIYDGMWTSRGTATLHNATLSATDVLANPTVMATLRLIAQRLAAIPFKVAEAST